MHLYLDIDSVETGKIRVTVKAEISEGAYVTIRKHLFMRIDLTPFVYDFQADYLTVYAKGVGEICIDQTQTQEHSYKILKVNGGEDVSDNNDAYNKLEVL